MTSCDSMCQALGLGTIDVVDVLRKVKQDTTLLDFVDKNHMIFNDDVSIFIGNIKERIFGSKLHVYSFLR